MLSLGPGSTCDVCLEPFGPESKGPCSIQCGHVFCLDCLHHLTYPHDADCQRHSPRSQCPLCRTPFDSHSIVKLHIDTESVQRGSPKLQQPPSPTVAEQEARRLQDAIAAVANTGSSETNLRALIEECRKFLAGQPRSMFPELRITHRMIAYLCEVKASLLSQSQASAALQGQVDRLDAEKGELERRIQELKETRRYERQTALTVEKSLRDHCSRAHEAYETVVDQYNFVVQEWMRLQHEVRLLRMPPTPHCPELDSPDMDMDPDMAKTPQPRPMAELDQKKLQSAAVQDPESYLISPLPQFTGRLPEAVALPDEDEQRERREAKKSPRKQGSQLSFQSFVVPPTPSARDCGASGHPYTCDCVEFAIFNEGAKKSGSRRSSITNGASTPVIDAKMKVPPPTPSSGPNPMMSPGRARSHTIPSHASRPPSRAPSPKPTSNDARDVYSPSHNNINIQGKGSESLKSRLHDLLQDNAGASSSLPIMSSTHFPSSLTRDTPPSSQQPDLPSRPPSRSGAPSSQHRGNPLLSPRQSTSERIGTSPQVPLSYVSPPTPSITPMPPAPVFSRASNAAMAMEKERKEKKELERERRRIEKEKKKAVEQEALPRPNSVSNTSTVVNASVSSSGYARQNGTPGRESTGPYPSQRNTSSSSTHGPSPIMSSTAYT